MMANIFCRDTSAGPIITVSLVNRFDVFPYQYMPGDRQYTLPKNAGLPEIAKPKCL